VKAQQHEGRTIARKRKKLGMTQLNLARAAGLNESRVSAFETGRAQLEAEEISRILKVFKQHAQRIFDAVFV
jgi:transcriptional regulator with XRE-family HTH domain